MRRLSTFSTEPGAAEGRCRSSERLAHVGESVSRVRCRVHQRVVEVDEGYSSKFRLDVNRYLWCCDGTVDQRQEHFAGAVRRRELLRAVPPRSGRHDASSHS